VKIAGDVLQRVDIIPERLWFILARHQNAWSVYHYLDGSYGQKNFGDKEEQAKQHIDSQEMCRDYYKELIGKRDKLILRIAPISNKLDAVTQQIDSLIVR